MNLLKQTFSEMREQPLACWLSIVGTAISLFLVMTVFTIDNIKTVAVSPESNRDRLLVGEGIEIGDQEGNSSSASCFAKKFGERIYTNLKGIEEYSFFSGSPETVNANEAGKLSEEYSLIGADHNYWKIFDFEFIEGKPYTKAESDAAINVAVLTEKAARNIFGKTNVTGREFLIKGQPYRVSGVVREGNPLMTLTYSDIFTPIKEVEGRGMEDWMTDYFGNFNVILLKKEGVTDESVKKQVLKRYERINPTLKKTGWTVNYKNTPYNMEEQSTPHGSNTIPEPEPERRQRYIMYAILLLLPAINLSGMTNSRLRRRVSEIGVRRAFGASRTKIISQMLTENFILTLIGGIIGLLLSVLFMYFLSALFINMTGLWITNEVQTSATPSFSMIFTWKGFGFSLLFCLILNIASAGIPVWKATAINPAEAISGNETENR